MGELVAALRANGPDAFRCWLFGGVQDLGEPVVEELLLDRLYSFLTVEEQDRLLAGHFVLLNYKKRCIKLIFSNAIAMTEKTRHF